MKYGKKLIAAITGAALCGTLLLGGVTGAAATMTPEMPESPFADVATTDWFFPYVALLHAAGGVEGVGDGNFNPQGTVTAGEFLAIGARLVCPDKIDTATPVDHWAYPYFDALKGRVAVFEEYPMDGTFRESQDYCGWVRIPEAVRYGYGNQSYTGMAARVERREMAEVLVDLAEKMGERLTILQDIENNLEDSASCSDDVLRAYSAGLLTGGDDGSFHPRDNMTRAEMCVVFCRLMGYVPRAQVTVQGERQSDYLITKGDDKGKIKYEYARQLGLEALSNMEVGQDEKGVYFAVVAPQVADEVTGCTFSFGASPLKANGDYFADYEEDLDLAPGESAKVYFTTFQGAPLKVSQISYMDAYVTIRREGYGACTAHMADTTTSEKILETRFHSRWGDEDEVIAFDVSHIFAGIGK